MSDKRYPTRMHEVLELGNQEEFEFKGENYSIDHNGVVYKKIAGSYFFADALIVSDMVNNPERIARRPRQTEEQVRRLKALYDYGMRWMFFAHTTARDPWLYATTNKPSYTEPDWDGQGGWSWSGERLRIKGSPLNDLERVCADAPLDIVQVLRQNGVEVEG